MANEPMVDPSVLRGRATPLDPLPPQPSGVCQCGCKTPVSRRYLLGHQRANVGPLAEERACGYITPCWVWVGAKVGGYGDCGNRAIGTRDFAHRAIYRETVGPIPDGYHVDHLCRIRACVNPDHLEAVTNAENVRRQNAAGFGASGKHNTAKTHCPQGHPYDEANTYKSRGRRVCRACQRDYMRRKRAA